MGHEGMISSLWEILDEADVVCHYNGKRFDVPVINREFLKYGYTPPSPYKQIDLLEVVKKQFRFVSNKLDHVCDELKIGKKLKHAGHELWLQCMAGDASAWKTMEKYNIQDVELIVELYEKLRPWITNHPNVALYVDSDDIVCPNCGSSHVRKRGLAHTKVFSYQRYQCNDCGTWSRGRVNTSTKEKNKSVITQEAF
jgi:DNA polymerase III epsilon subunit-like protein